MDNREYEYFIEIARSGSISAAARNLNVSQPSLTQYIQRLEASYGTSFFVRNGYGVSLTDSGRIFLTHAIQSRSLETELKHKLEDRSELRSGTLRIGANWYLSSTLLPEFVSTFAKKHPAVEMVCHENRTDELIRMLGVGSLDFALLCMAKGSEKNLSKGLDVEVLYYDPFCLAVPDGERAAVDENGYIAAEGLSDLNLVRFHPKQKIGLITQTVFDRMGFDGASKTTVYSFPLAMSLVREGFSVVLPKGYLAKEAPQVKTYEFKPELDAGWNVVLCRMNYTVIPSVMAESHKLLYNMTK